MYQMACTLFSSRLQLLIRSLNPATPKNKILINNLRPREFSNLLNWFKQLLRADTSSLPKLLELLINKKGWEYLSTILSSLSKQWMSGYQTKIWDKCLGIWITKMWSIWVWSSLLCCMTARGVSIRLWMRSNLMLSRKILMIRCKMDLGKMVNTWKMMTWWV